VAGAVRGSRVEKNKTNAIDANSSIVKNVHKLRGIPVLRNIKNTAATAYKPNASADALTNGFIGFIAAIRNQRANANMVAPTSPVAAGSYGPRLNTPCTVSGLMNNATPHSTETAATI
jgi:hypothetical protein